MKEALQSEKEVTNNCNALQWSWIRKEVEDITTLVEEKEHLQKSLADSNRENCELKEAIQQEKETFKNPENDSEIARNESSSLHKQNEKSKDEP